MLRRGALLLALLLLALAHGRAAAANDAAFVSQTVPAAMTVGETYTMTISMKNTGSGTTWTAASGYSLVMQGSSGWGITSLPVAASTALNVTRPFTTTAMTPPSTPGTYSVQWCMVQNGVKFGACSTPVSVQVAARVLDATFGSQTVFNTQIAETRAITVTMKNTGNVTWKPAQVSLMTQNPAGHSTWGINRLKLSANVAPNASGVFSGTITAPSPGYYDLQWQAFEEGKGYFGEPAANQHIAVAGDPPTLKIESPTTGLKLISSGGYIDVPFRVVATPTGIAAIKKINVMVVDADGLYVPVLTSDSGVLDASHRRSVSSTTTRVAYYVQATDTIPRSSTMTVVNVDVLNDNSTFVSTTWPTTMVPGIEYDVEFVLKNSGGTTWDPQTVALENTYASGNDLWGAFSARLSSPVLPGENGTFKFRVIAPATEGGYTLQARLKESTRAPFGVALSRSVTVARQVPVVTMTAPATGLTMDVAAGQTAKVRVQGNATPGAFATISKLDVLDGTAVIATVDGATINQDVELAPGTHTLKLRATDNWNEIGTSTAATVTVKGNGAAYVSQSVPATMQVGKAYTASITMRNAGNKSWTAATGYALGSQNPVNNTVWRDNRVTSTATVAANGQVTFSVPVTAPAVPGTYNFQWQMLQEGVEWFGALTPNVEVVVNPLAPSVGALSLPLAGATYNATSGKAEVRVVATVPASSGAQIGKIEVLDGTTVIATNDSGSIDQVVLLATGAHTLKLRATDNFGQVTTGTATTAITVLADGATVVSNDLPAKMVPGVAYEGTVVFKNSGQTTWDPHTVALIPYNAAHRTAFGDASFPLTSSVAPGDSASFKVKVTAPPAEGSYTFAMQLNDSTRANFGGYSSKVVTVAWVPPTVTISSPVTGSTSDVPTQTVARVLVQGSATPGDFATISQIEVLDGSAVIATVGGAAINQYVELAVGTHSLRLRATDNMGQTALSAIATHTVKGNDAAYVSQVVPATMQVGKTYTPTVTMRNAGNKPWTAATGYALGSQNPQNNALWRDNRVTSTATVAANGQVTFSVPVTAPSKPGTYNFQWQMLQDGVEWFGPLTPNVEVVVNPLAPVVGALSLPVAGAKYTAASGKADVLVQGTVPASEGAQIDKLEVLDGSTVVATMYYSSTIEEVVQLATGSHTLKLRATDNFGQVVTGTATTAITVLYNGATMVSRTTTTPMVSNNSYQVTVVMRNAGNSTWTAEDGYALGATPDDHTWAAEFFPVTGSIAPGQNATFTFNVFAPADPGVYPQQWQMLQQDKDYIGTGAVREWFGAKTTVQNITVTGAPPTVTLTGPASGTKYTAVNGLASVPVTGTARAVGSASISTFEVLDGSTVKFTGSGNNLNTPVSLAPGTHTLQLRATDSRGAAATSGTTTVTVLHNDASFVTQSVPSSMYAGDPYTVSLTVKNTGDATWQPYSAQTQLGVVLQELPAASTVWTKTGRVPLTKAVAPGETYTFSIDVIAPLVAKQYPFQWRMGDESKEVFGTNSTLVNISVAPAPVPVVSLGASPVNQRVAPGQTGAVTLVGSASEQNGVLSKLEVYADSGSGYGSTPIKTVNGSAAQLSLNETVSLPNGSYRLKLRATDSSGHFGESAAVTINITDSPLLGKIVGVRSYGAQQLQLVGWACRDNSPDALNYQVFANAPPVLGGVPVASGVANLGSEAGDQGVQEQCHTPGISHFFTVDLASLQLQYPGAPLYVVASSSQGGNIVLPCEDHGCRIPDGLRIGMTSPNANNLDRFRLPIPAFARAVVTGYTGTPDEVSFNINGEWLPGIAEGAGAYSVSKADLQASTAPYAAFAKVRQGDTTLITDTRLFYVDPGIVLGGILPKDGSTLPPGKPVVLSTTVDVALAPGQSVKFFIDPKNVQAKRMLARMASPAAINGSVVGDATFDGTKWVYAWTPTVDGSYTVVAKVLDSGGGVIMETASITLNISASLSPVDATPVSVDIAAPIVSSVTAGTLPGQLAIGNDGAATYSIPLDVPPGTAGVQPKLSLDYSSMGTNGVAGLGWTLSGLSTIQRCPKTIAQDGKAGRISFDTADRLCVDGVRLVLANLPLTDDNYWAPTAEYRTEINDFSRVTRLANAGFKIEAKDGRISFYGTTAQSAPAAAGRSDGQVVVWALDRVEDRKTNFLIIEYTHDATTGETLVDQVRYGGNRLANQSPDLAVRFVYKTRPDEQQRYIGGSRSDLHYRLTNILNFINTDAGGQNGQLVRDYAVNYIESPTSGRSLIDYVQACAVDTNGGKDCLPETKFDWGGGTAPTLKELPIAPFFMPSFDGRHTADFGIPADLDGSGRPSFLSTMQLGATLIPGAIRIRLPNGIEFTRVIDVTGMGMPGIGRIKVGDLDGDGRDDLFSNDGYGSATVPGGFYCLTVPAEDGTVNFNCRPMPGNVQIDTMADVRNDRRMHLIATLNSATVTDCYIDAGTMRCDSLPLGGVVPPVNPSHVDGTSPDPYGINRVIVTPVDLSAQAMSDFYRLYATGEGGFVGHINACLNKTQGFICQYLLDVPRIDNNGPYLGTQSLIGDVNGDGIADILYTAETRGAQRIVSNGATSVATNDRTVSRGVCLGTENAATCNIDPNLAMYSFVPGDFSSSTDKMSESDRSKVGDFFGDGVERLIFAKKPNPPGENGARSVACRYQFYGSVCQEFDYSVIFGEQAHVVSNFDGSGLPVFLYSGAHSSTPFAWTAYSLAGVPEQDKIVGVSNGLGQRQEVSYARGNDASVYSRYVVSNGKELRPGYPLYAVNPGVLAKELRRDNGKGGWLRYQYRFEGAMRDAYGRGEMGFGSVQMTDLQSGLVTATTFEQTFPYVGKVLATTTSTTSITPGVATYPVTISAVENRYARKDTQLASGAVSVFPFLAGNTEMRLDLDGSYLGYTTTRGSASSPDIQYDEWGNLVSSMTLSMGTWESMAGAFYTDKVNSYYPADIENWQVGLMKTSELRKSQDIGDTTSISRHTSYEYESDHSGLLRTVTVEPDDPKLRVKTLFDRSGNPFGLANAKTMSWLDPISGEEKSRTEKTVYDGRGRFATQRENAVGHVETYEYDGISGAITKFYPAGQLPPTSWAVDGFGRIVLERLPNGNETRYRRMRCAANCPAYAVSAETSEIWHGASRIAAPQVKYSDVAGNVIAVRKWGLDGRPIIVENFYDDLGRMAEIGRPRFVDEPYYLERRQQYDALDRVTGIATIDDDGVERLAKVDYHGLVTVVTNAKQQVRTDYHDVLGRVLQTKDALGKLTIFEYDAFNNRTKTIDPMKHETVVQYDASGQRLSMTDPDLGRWEYQPDAVGQVRSVSSPNQRKKNQRLTEFKYDPLGRMVERIEPDLISGWVFDQQSNESGCSVTHSCGSLVEAYTMVNDLKDYRRLETYDAFGRASTTTHVLGDGVYSRTIDYDDWGRVIAFSSIRGADTARRKKFDLRYNQYGYLERIQREDSVLWLALKNDASMQTVEQLFGNGLNQLMTYKPNSGHLYNAELLNKSAGIRLHETYTYDPLGNVLSRSQYWDKTGFQEFFTYDDLNRLKTSDVTGKNNPQSFSYDDAGSILSKTGVGSGAQAKYEYPLAGELGPRRGVKFIPGVGQFNYDENGNLTSGNGLSLEWSSFDMPALVSKNTSRGKFSSSFVYGPEHQRIRQTKQDGAQIIYVNNQEVELDRSNNVKSVKTYWPFGIGLEIEHADGLTDLFWTHVDRLGSPVAISDSTGELKDYLAYDAWGKRRTVDGGSLGGTATPDEIVPAVDNKGFTGHEMLDDLELVHMNGRIYDPFIARVLSPDPLVQDSSNGQNFNRYSYVLNNPTNIVDPTGFYGIDPVVGTVHSQESSPAGTGLSQDVPGKRLASDMMVAQANEAARTSQQGGRVQDPVNGRKQTQQPQEKKSWLDRYRERKAEDEEIMRKTDEALAADQEMLRVYISGKWAEIADWADEKRSETGNLLYAVPSAWGHFVNSPGYEKFSNAVEIIGMMKGGPRSSKLPRFNGKKPAHDINPAHVRGKPGFNRQKTPQPADAEKVYEKAVPNDPERPTAWFGRNSQGQVYRYSDSNDGKAHFSGIEGEGSSTRNFNQYARDRLDGK